MSRPQYVHLRDRWHVHGMDSRGCAVVEARFQHAVACFGLVERGGRVMAPQPPRRHPLDFLAEHPELVLFAMLLVAFVVWLVIR
jgi:hypothetical protein